MLAEMWQIQEKRAHNLPRKMERCKNKGAVKEAKNIEIAWRFIQDEVVDHIGKNSAIRVLGMEIRDQAIEEGVLRKW